MANVRIISVDPELRCFRMKLDDGREVEVADRMDYSVGLALRVPYEICGVTSDERAEYKAWASGENKTRPTWFNGSVLPGR